MACIDVILPAYNVEKMIGTAIDSILSQTFTDWRLIICDDGSKDNTVDVIKDYEKKYPHKIVAIQNDENKGITFTLNRMISMTKAKYVARMDADDVSRQDRFEEQVAFLDSNPDYGLVGANIIKFDEDGIFGSYQYPERPTKMDFLWNSPFAHPSVMIRKEILDRVGGYWDKPRTKRCEDFDLWMRLYEAGYKGYNIQKPIFEYYEGRNSYRKRKFKYRIAEMSTRIYGYHRLGLMPKGALYALKPLIVGLIPKCILVGIRKG